MWDTIKKLGKMFLMCMGLIACLDIVYSFICGMLDEKDIEKTIDSCTNSGSDTGSEDSSEPVEDKKHRSVGDWMKMHRRKYVKLEGSDSSNF